MGGLWPLGGNLPPPPPPQTPRSVRSTPRAAELYNSICWAFTTSHIMGFCSVRHSLVFSRMDMQNEVQLKLHNFQENMITSFNHQRKHSDFSDVTLISEDRQKFPVHKIILSSGSGFFHTILRELRYETHSVIYLRGIKAKLLDPMLDFLYKGSVNLANEEVETFLILAREMELKGLQSNLTKSTESATKEDLKMNLTRSTESSLEEDSKTDLTKPTESSLREDSKTHLKETPKQSIEEDSNTNLTVKDEVKDSKTSGQSGFLLEDISQETENHIVPEVQNNPTRFPSGLVVLRFKEKNQQLSQAVDALMLNTGHGWSCLGCGKQTPRKQYMMKHVEVHIEGFAHICDYCKNKFKTRGSLQVHLSQSLSCKHAHSMIYQVAN